MSKSASIIARPSILPARYQDVSTQMVVPGVLTSRSSRFFTKPTQSVRRRISLLYISETCNHTSLHSLLPSVIHSNCAHTHTHISVNDNSRLPLRIICGANGLQVYVTGVTMSSDCASEGEVSLSLQDELDCSLNETETRGTWASAAYNYIEHKSTLKVDATEFLSSSFPANGQVGLKIRLPKCASSIGDEATLSVATKQWGLLNLRSAKRSNWLDSLWPF